MAEAALNSPLPAEEQSRRIQVRRVIDMVLRPRVTLAALHEVERAVWLTPLLFIIALLIVRVLAIAPIRAAQAESGAGVPPPGFEYYTPEQQAQLQQALEATKGPVFQVVFPIGWALISALLLWSITAGLLYLLSTLQGGRGSMTRALNLTAWASVPTIVHLIVQVVAVQTSGALIGSPGLSGFTPPPPEGSVLARALLSRVDLYLFWHIALLVIGLKAFTGLSTRKAWVSVLVSITIVMLLRILPDLLAAQLGGLTVVRPFLF